MMTKVKFRIINQSPYETKALRAVATAIGRTKQHLLNRTGGITLRVLMAGARAPALKPSERIVRVPKLTGNEWIAAARAVENNLGVLTNVSFANVVCDAMRWFRIDWAVRPTPIPLVVREAKEPVKRDVIRQRYERVLKLEKSWARKLKLAQTKIKKLRAKAKYYQKRLAARKGEGAMIALTIDDRPDGQVEER